jgi:four helix bundle protein
MTYRRFEDLPVWQAASDLFARIDAICEHEELRKRGDLANQLHRATLSISNNIAEGFELGTTQQLITFLYIARGSAGEVRNMLCQVENIPRFSNLKFEISNLKSQAEQISRQLRAFADSLQNSDIQGQRYLNNRVQDQIEMKSRRTAFEAKLAAMTADAKRQREHRNSNGDAA